MKSKSSREMISPNLLKMIDNSLSIREKSAREAGELGFMAKLLIQATLPHRDPKTTYFERKNGNYTLTLSSPSQIGLPFGVKPRLLLCWIATEAVRKREKTLYVGESLSEFMKKIGFDKTTGGKNGSITSFKEQMLKLLSCSITCVYAERNYTKVKNLHVSTMAEIRTTFWESKKHIGNEMKSWDSTFTMNQEFFNEIVKFPVPIDMRALCLLKKSPMAIDVYCWLVYRLSYLKRQTVVPWPMLMDQFGCDYARIDNFKAKFIWALKKVCIAYPEARVEAVDAGLKLSNSKLHIPRK